MNIKQLKNELAALSVSTGFYSINGNIRSDTYVLNVVYGKWEYFYFDEKGNRQNYKMFEAEDAACEFFLKIIKEELSYPTRSFKGEIN